MYRYNKLAGLATKLVSLLKELKPDDPFRIKITDQLLEKLYAFGAIPTRTSISIVERLSTSSIAKRRLPVIMVKTKMAQTMKEAVTFIEQARAPACDKNACFSAIDMHVVFYFAGARPRWA